MMMYENSVAMRWYSWVESQLCFAEDLGMCTSEGGEVCEQSERRTESASPAKTFISNESLFVCVSVHKNPLCCVLNNRTEKIKSWVARWLPAPARSLRAEVRVRWDRVVKRRRKKIQKNLKFFKCDFCLSCIKNTLKFKQYVPQIFSLTCSMPTPYPHHQQTRYQTWGKVEGNHKFWATVKWSNVKLVTCIDVDLCQKKRSLCGSTHLHVEFCSEYRNKSSDSLAGKSNRSNYHYVKPIGGGGYAKSPS